MFSRVLLHLSLIDGIGPAAVLPLIASFEQADRSYDLLYQLTVPELQSFGLNKQSAARIHIGLADTKILEQELALIEKYGVYVVTLADKEYPEQLSTIHLPPLVLYCKGSVDLKYNQQIAIVGSRNADRYGACVVANFVPALTRAQWYIVSGGARGIDGLVHQETLKMGGRTVVVMGSGLLKPYPKMHTKLFKQIIDQGGALLSSYPLTMEALPGLFPARNRIIAGLTRGCIVVQAAEKSGALITAHYALQEGREVFAVPGAIDNPLSAGCHQLIAQGAILAASAFDVLQAFGQAPAKVVKSPALRATLTPAEQIVELCSEPISFQELLQQAGFEAGVTQDLLYELSMEGKIVQNKVGLWCASSS